MPPKRIKVETSYEELESKVLECLRDEDVCDVHAHAWEEVGASAVLRRAAEAVEKKELIEFDTAIKLVPLAAYRSPREAQRAVAEQLNLQPSIMAKFDEADEDDDFGGVPAGERGKVMEVAKEIYRAVKDRRVLLVYRVCLAEDGSAAVIDFNDLGIPILGWRPNKVLWTFGREFPYAEPSPQQLSQQEVRLEKADAIVYVPKNGAAAAALECVYAEAVEVARYIFEGSGRKLLPTPSTVHGCLWHLFLLLRYIRSQDRRRQVVDYLVCEQIAQGEGDHAACWEIGKALARMVLPDLEGRDSWKLLKEISTPGELRSVSPELLPPKTLIIDPDIYKHEEYRILSSQQEGSSRGMAVKSISPDDPELGDFLDNICGRDDLERGTSVFCNFSSVFWKFEPTCRALPDRLFERFTNVRVLDLFGCIVGPIDSSFVHLRNLRMLRMEECQVTGEQHSSVSASPLLLAQEGLGGPILFESLWVLILYNSDADKFLLAGRAFDHMPNLHKFYLEDETFAFPHLAARKGLGSLRKLRINCPVQLEETDEGFFQHMHKLQSLDLSENTHIRFLPKSLSMAINLRKLNLDDCRWLESLNLNHLPATIEAVSLRSCESLQEVELADPTSLPNLKTFRLTKSVRITQLSLQGCRKLEHVDLQELLGLEVLNLSGTAVKALKFYDVNAWSYNLPELKQLYLLGCEQLRRVDLQHLPRLDVLYLDNYSNNCSVDRCLESFKNQTEHYTTGISDSNGRFFQAHIVVRDARLLRSFHRVLLNPYLDRTEGRIHIHVKHSSTTKRGDITDATTEPGARITSSTKSSPLIVSHLSTPRYADVLDAMKDHRRPFRPSPPAMPLNHHIEVDGGNRGYSLIEEESFRDFMRSAESLFVHENTSALAVNVSMRWLKCFRIENCPNMEFVFADWDEDEEDEDEDEDEDDNVLEELESMWLSCLPRLNAVCKRGIRIAPESYPQLKHIYLEFCSRIRYVLPSLPELHNLETIDIRCCGELRAIFVDYDEDEEDKRGATPKLLPKLRSIHLEELPKLQHIYKPHISAPSLQNIVIRGCLSLRKLSLFDRSDGQSRRVVKISCEKDWWGNLKWDEPEANYCSFLFDPKHCPFYKKPKKARWL